MFLLLGLTLLSMTISRSIHDAANGMISFCLTAEWYSIVNKRDTNELIYKIETDSQT